MRERDGWRTVDGARRSIGDGSMDIREGRSGQHMDGGGRSEGESNETVIALDFNLRPQICACFIRVLTSDGRREGLMTELDRRLNLMSRERVSEQARSTILSLDDEQEMGICRLCGGMPNKCS